MTSRLMQALVKAKPEPGLWMEEVPVPVPAVGEVLVKVRRSAILRHRPPYLELGQLGPTDHSGADGGRP